ncbi:MAG: DUF952 domain-containing protein [Chloroflexota bacterium]
MRETYHLVPEAVWSATDSVTPYVAASLEPEGFVHCTDGIDPLGVTFDRYYATDARPFLALTIDLDALEAPWRYDIPGSPYPHIYGPISRSAVLGVSHVERTPEGTFAGLISDTIHA